jgi:hypothetical protein
VLVVRRVGEAAVRLRLIDDEHALDRDGTLYVCVGNRWRPGASHPFDRFFEERGYAEHEAPQALADFLSERTGRAVSGVALDLTAAIRGKIRP